MKTTLLVPQIDYSWGDATYTARVEYRDAIRAGAKRIGASRIGRCWYYQAQETGEVWRVTSRELAQLGAGEIDGRGSDYSLWCSCTGRRIPSPSANVKIALGL